MQRRSLLKAALAAPLGFLFGKKAEGQPKERGEFISPSAQIYNEIYGDEEYQRRIIRICNIDEERHMEGMAEKMCESLTEQEQIDNILKEWQPLYEQKIMNIRRIVDPDGSIRTIVQALPPEERPRLFSD